MTYFFHLDGLVDLSDAVEIEAANLADARQAAILGIRDILCHDAISGEIDVRRRIDITDGKGALLLSVSFEEAVIIRS
jgi:hypothetical protein